MSEKDKVLDLLLEQGLLMQEQIDKAREETKRTGLSLEKALEKLGFVTQEDILNARAQVLGVPYIDLNNYIVDTEILKLIPEEIARKYRVVPLFKIGSSLNVAMSNPEDIVALDELRRTSKMDSIDGMLASEEGIRKVLDSCYGLGDSVEDIVKSIAHSKLKGKQERALAESAEEPPIIRLINIIFMQAVKDRASDIHVEPEEDTVRIRYRIDGIMQEINILPKELQGPIISRIKILSDLDIAENRKPQDGRIRLKLEHKDLDVRVSTFPTVYGENVVMRLLDKASVLLGIKDLHFSEENLDLFGKLIHRPHGIILVTGPTGSGKTTTLYAALSNISSNEKNIITIEDPVEYKLTLIRQTQINPKADITFANGLRSILRQDPDVIMVGEIRDKETSEVAIQAALTGHLVFSTLHTNDAPSALTRLIDMGVEPFLISSSVVGILAQRLVRTICAKCKEKYDVPDSVFKKLGIEIKAEFYHGKGCSECHHTGFIGRVGIFELLVMDEEIRRMVNERKSADLIRKSAIASGMKTLLDDGIDKARRGLTTLDEVLRVTVAEG
ncbi:MAG: type II/IV secretion system protein [Candidatus Omnitrophica bacterium]|nr:type II/IV secretion system protein [Candidatus Omnitrophota bacterium]